MAMHDGRPWNSESNPGDARSADLGIDGAPFGFVAPMDPLLPIVLAVPHAGRAYPSDLLQQMRHPEQASIRLEDRLVDQLGLSVAQQCGAGVMVAHAPRAMIDLNRHPDDVDWTMVAGGVPKGAVQHLRGGRATTGLGLVPRRIASLGELWRRPMTRKALDWRRDQIHAPYHSALGQTLADMRDRCGSALLIDLHSMPPLGPKDGDTPAADFVIGDRLGASCDWRIAALCLEHFGQHRFHAAHNRPYAGGYVLDRHGRPLEGVHAVQIEVCRATYLDDALREPGEGFAAVAAVLASLVLRLADSLPQAAPLRDAAE